MSTLDYRTNDVVAVDTHRMTMLTSAELSLLSVVWAAMGILGADVFCFVIKCDESVRDEQGLDLEVGFTTDASDEMVCQVLSLVCPPYGVDAEPRDVLDGGPYWVANVYPL